VSQLDPSPAVTPGAEAENSASSCPPPLQWQEVLREFHKQADAWYLDRPNYRISGRSLGAGPPLYFLNGFAGSHELFALLVWLLRDQFRCVLFDYPVLRQGSSTLPDLADDVAAIAEVCGDRSINLFATAFGSLVALEVMLRHPRLISRAILQGGFAHRDLSLAERWLVQIGRLMPVRYGRIPGRAAIQRQNHRRWFPPFDTTRFQFFLDNSGVTLVRDLAQRGKIVRDCDLRPQLGQIDQPVLLVRCEGDGQILSGYGDELARGLPHASQDHLNDTGQIPFLTHPHRLAKIIRPFLEGG
jgi:pimeloyl-ACP methyl ester carboxylesterase